MPNFKVFQDQAQSMKVQIYGSDTNAALKTDTSGSLDVSASTALPISSTTVTPISADTALPISSTTVTPISASTALPISSTTVTPISADTALPISSTTVTPISASTALPISSTTVTPISASTALPITTNGELLPVSVALATTDVVFDSLTGITNGGPGFERQVLGLGQWTYGVVNASPSSNNAITYLQMSPDGNNWIKDGATYTIAYNGTAALVAGVFLKYARVYYYAQDATNSAVTLNVFFQGNTVE